VATALYRLLVFCRATPAAKTATVKLASASVVLSIKLMECVRLLQLVMPVHHQISALLRTVKQVLWAHIALVYHKAQFALQPANA
jgi:hypothetical protein